MEAFIFEYIPQVTEFEYLVLCRLLVVGVVGLTVWVLIGIEQNLMKINSYLDKN